MEICCFQICYFFYKNIAFGLTLFYFEAFTGFSGQSIYDDWYMLSFNVILTSLPVISLGVFEQDVSSEVCLQVSTSNNAFVNIKTIYSDDRPATRFITSWFCSSLHCISKDPEICSLIGTEYWGGWATVSIALSLSSSSTLSSSLIRPSDLMARLLIWLLWVQLCSVASSGLSTARLLSQCVTLHGFSTALFGAVLQCGTYFSYFTAC